MSAEAVPAAAAAVPSWTMTEKMEQNSFKGGEKWVVRLSDFLPLSSHVVGEKTELSRSRRKHMAREKSLSRAMEGGREGGRISHSSHAPAAPEFKPFAQGENDDKGNGRPIMGQFRGEDHQVVFVVQLSRS